MSTPACSKVQNMDDYGFGLMAVMGMFFAVILVIMLVLYLIDAIAKYKYLRVRSYENAWMAFIPIINIWAVVEATYGNGETINMYGWDAPAVVVKLWPIVTYVLAAAINLIPFVGQFLSLALAILNFAVMLMIYRDMMERLGKQEDIALAIILVLISIAASIKILMTSSNFAPGSQDYKNDDRVLSSQTATDGPLSFMNGNK